MAGPVDIDTFVDGLKFSRLHLRIIVICTMMMMIDGFDLQVLAWVLPKVAEDFGVVRTALTPALVSQQIGMVLGAYLVTPLGDKLGRRGLLLLCISCVVVSSFVTIFTSSVITLAACRLVTGMFASAMIANLVSMSSEIAPKRMRSTVVTIVLAGSMGGAILGSLMQAFLIEPFGWRGAFVIATALPLIMLPIVYFGLPESLRFLATRNPDDPRVAQLVRRLLPAGAEPVTLRPRETALDVGSGRLGAGGPFSPGMAGTTLILWLAFICSFTYIGSALWKTTVFRDVVGMPWSQVAATTAVNTAAGAVGMLAIGFCIDRFGFRRVVPAFFILAGLGTVMTGVWAPSLLMFFAIAFMGMFQHGAHAGLASLASILYPTKSRATGVGWAYGAGRVASIFGPMLGAAALHHNLGATGFFVFLGMPLILAGICVFVLMQRAPPEALANLKAH